MTKNMWCETVHSQSYTTFSRHSAVLSVPAVLLRNISLKFLACVLMTGFRGYTNHGGVIQSKGWLSKGEVGYPRYPTFTKRCSCYSRFSCDVTAAMLVYRTTAKKVFWDLFYYYPKLKRNFAIVLYTNMAASSRDWKPRISLG